MSTDLLLAAAFAFVIAVGTTPAGVSGAVLLLPVQVSVLHVPNPAVTPTNLLYNVLATPGALLRLWRDGALRSRLIPLMLAGTLPGVVLGAVVRVELLSGPKAFLAVIAAVLGPMGIWLLFGRQRESDWPRREATWRLVPVSFAVGAIGGVYGIGGGSILAPLLVGAGFAVRAVAPAALATTFVTSVVGVITFEVLQGGKSGAVGPDWPIGIAAGFGGLIGAYVGASLRDRVPELALRRGLGALSLIVAIRYVVLAV